jgi:hypothetical protein
VARQDPRRWCYFITIFKLKELCRDKGGGKGKVNERIGTLNNGILYGYFVDNLKIL